MLLCNQCQIEAWQDGSSDHHRSWVKARESMCSIITLLVFNDISFVTWQTLRRCVCTSRDGKVLRLGNSAAAPIHVDCDLPLPQCFALIRMVESNRKVRLLVLGPHICISG